MQGQITAVQPVWQRNHMVAGEGRKAEPVKAAEDALLGRRGRVADLLAAGRGWARRSAVTVRVTRTDGVNEWAESDKWAN